MKLRSSDIPLILVILYLMVSMFTLVSAFSGSYSLPSPLYGGDYYFQAGAIKHLLEGGSFFSSSSMLEGAVGYFPLYSLFITGISLLGVSLFQSMFVGSIILFLFSFIIFFFYGKSLSGRNDFALFMALLLVPISIIMKYTEFAFMVIAPLVMLSFFTYNKHKSLTNVIVFGLIWGLLAWSNNLAFMGVSILLVLLLVWEKVSCFRNKNKLFEKNELKYLLLIFIIVFILAIPFWYKPIVVHGMHSMYDRIHMDFPDFARFDIKFNFIWTSFQSLFLNLTSVRTIILSLFSITGLFAIFFAKKKEFIILRRGIIISLFIVFSYFITELFGLNINPVRQFSLLSLIIFFPFLLYTGFNFIKSKVPEKFQKKFVYSILFICVILILFNTLTFVSWQKDDIRMEVSKKSLPLNLLHAAEYFEDYSSINSVILSCKECSFIINGLTGRKVMVNRWAQQNDPFIDLPQRDLDAALILYGSNDTLRKELLKKYKVEFIYWDIRWNDLEYRFNDDGTIKSHFDPLMFYYSKEREDLLVQNNISYIRNELWVDPSVRNDKIRMYDLLLISPDNYANRTYQWNEALDKYLDLSWTFNHDNITSSEIFKVNKTRI